MWSRWRTGLVIVAVLLSGGVAHADDVLPLDRLVRAQQLLSATWDRARWERYRIDVDQSDSGHVVVRRKADRDFHIVAILPDAGLPDYVCQRCLEYIRDESLTTTDEQAVRIALAHGFAKGVRPWKVFRSTYGNEDRVVWSVENVIEIRGSEIGEHFVIDEMTKARLQAWGYIRSRCGN